jgi:uncharacterized phage protein gp47/JayE
VALSLQTFTTMVQNAAAAVQGACSTLLNVAVGSVERAVLQACASIGLWIQWLLVLLYARQRLATSTGVDVDSYVDDFISFGGRLPAVAANGTLTLARFTATSAATVPVGTQARTFDASQSYTIIADPTNPLWNGTGFTIPALTASANFLAVATVPGLAGDALPGTITLLASAVPYIDTVTNAVAFTNGFDAESDSALAARFQLFIQSRSAATKDAIEFAIASVQTGLTSYIASNQDALGNFLPGNFVVTVNDGSGNPPASLITAVYLAITAVRGLTISFSVQGPTTGTVTVSLTIFALANFVKATLQPLVEAAIIAYIDGLAVGAPLYYTQLVQAIYSAVPGVANITNLLINGAVLDVIPAVTETLEAGTVAVN